MADAKDEDYKPLMLKRTDDAVVADAVAPQLAESSVERFADFAGIVEFTEPFVQKLRDSAGDGFVELIEFFLSRRIELNRPLLV